LLSISFQAVKKNKIVVFMKGVPEAPQCGFSNAVAQILDMHGVKGYVSFNVLDDQELRQEIKACASSGLI
jgi:monothiol glutaredoxin